MRVKGVIFDLDGTLVDSMWMWKQIDVEFLGRYGLEVPKDLERVIEGMSFSETAVYFKERFQLPMTLDEIKSTWNQMALDKYSNEVKLKPGADEFLQYLSQNGVAMGIATSNSRQLVDAVTKALHIQGYFGSITTACEVKAGKPAPDIYYKVSEDLKVKPDSCVVFEDVPAGILAGKRAGMKVYAVEDEFSKDLKNEKVKLADGYIKDYREIIQEWVQQGGVCYA